MIQNYPKSILLLHNSLHAKLYRADDSCLLGSANITDRALGWSWQPNIELMVHSNASENYIVELEKNLLQNSFLATQSIHDAMKFQVMELIESNSEFKAFQTTQTEIKWLPICFRPECLYRIYSEKQTSGLLDSIVQSGKHDLIKMQVPGGMTESEFESYVRFVLEQHPVTQEINNMSKTSMTTDVALEIIEKYYQQLSIHKYDASTHWEILKAWLMHFFPSKYRVKAVTEVFEQAKFL